MERILILGGSGFLGRALISHLAAGDYEIHAVVRSEESAGKVNSASPRAIAITAERAAGEQYERVINLVVDYGRSGASLSHLLRTNLVYPLGLIETVDPAAVLNVSTALPEAYSNYASSKKMLERCLDRLADQRGFRNVNVHLHNMYGPGSGDSNFVTVLIDRMLRSEPVELSSCRNSRDFIYIDDVAAALEILSRQLENVPNVPTVHIGTGRATRLTELVDMIKGRTGSSSRVHYGARPDNPAEPPILVADDAALSVTGWKPAWSLDQGLDATIRLMTRAQTSNAPEYQP